MVAATVTAIVMALANARQIQRAMPFARHPVIAVQHAMPAPIVHPVSGVKLAIVVAKILACRSAYAQMTIKA